MRFRRIRDTGGIRRRGFLCTPTTATETTMSRIQNVLYTGKTRTTGGRDGEGGYFLQARLNVSLPGIEAGLAQELVEAAHATCPYSKATRGNIDVSLQLA